MRENETEDLIELNFEGDNDFPIIREDGLRRDVTSLVTVTAAGKIEAVAIAVNLGSIEEVVKIWTISRFMRVILAQGPC